MTLTSRPKSKAIWDGNTYKPKRIGRGVSGIVLELDEGSELELEAGKRLVVKIPNGSSESFLDIRIEQEAYRILSKQPLCEHVTKCYDYTDPRGIILEKLDETVRRKLNHGQLAPLRTILSWSLGAAKGLDFIHSRNIIQGDVGCHNMLLDREGTLKLCDFSGSSVRGKEATVNYETRSQAPFSYIQPDEDTDIFALGSAIYEMCCGHAPYNELPDYEVTRLYEKHKFPDCPEHMDQDLWTIIHKCWEKGFDSQAGKVANHLERVIKKLDNIDNTQTEMKHRSTPNINQIVTQQPKRSSRNHLPPATYPKKRSKQRNTRQKSKDTPKDNLITRVWKFSRKRLC